MGNEDANFGLTSGEVATIRGLRAEGMCDSLLAEKYELTIAQVHAICRVKVEVRLTLNANGRRIGECHPKARLSDADVDRIRELHEVHGLSLGSLANLYQCGKSTVADICNYRHRAQTPEG